MAVPHMAAGHFDLNPVATGRGNRWNAVFSGSLIWNSARYPGAKDKLVVLIAEQLLAAQPDLNPLVAQWNIGRIGAISVNGTHRMCSPRTQ